jgi:hypothetical protein
MARSTGYKPTLVLSGDTAELSSHIGGVAFQEVNPEEFERQLQAVNEWHSTVRNLDVFSQLWEEPSQIFQKCCRTALDQFERFLCTRKLSEYKHCEESFQSVQNSIIAHHALKGPRRSHASAKQMEAAASVSAGATSISADILRLSIGVPVSVQVPPEMLVSFNSMDQMDLPTFKNSLDKQTKEVTQQLAELEMLLVQIGAVGDFIVQTQGVLASVGEQIQISKVRYDPRVGEHRDLQASTQDQTVLDGLYHAIRQAKDEAETYEKWLEALETRAEVVATDEVKGTTGLDVDSWFFLHENLSSIKLEACNQRLENCKTIVHDSFDQVIAGLTQAKHLEKKYKKPIAESITNACHRMLLDAAITTDEPKLQVEISKNQLALAELELQVEISKNQLALQDVIAQIENDAVDLSRLSNVRREIHQTFWKARGGAPAKLTQKHMADVEAMMSCEFVAVDKDSRLNADGNISFSGNVTLQDIQLMQGSTGYKASFDQENNISINELVAEADALRVERPSARMVTVANGVLLRQALDLAIEDLERNPSEKVSKEIVAFYDYALKTLADQNVQQSNGFKEELGSPALTQWREGDETVNLKALRTILNDASKIKLRGGPFQKTKICRLYKTLCGSPIPMGFFKDVVVMEQKRRVNWETVKKGISRALAPGAQFSNLWADAKFKSALDDMIKNRMRPEYHQPLKVLQENIVRLAEESPATAALNDFFKAFQSAISLWAPKENQEIITSYHQPLVNQLQKIIASFAGQLGADLMAQICEMPWYQMRRGIDQKVKNDLLTSLVQKGLEGQALYDLCQTFEAWPKDDKVAQCYGRTADYTFASSLFLSVISQGIPDLKALEIAGTLSADEIGIMRNIFQSGLTKSATGQLRMPDYVLPLGPDGVKALANKLKQAKKGLPKLKHHNNRDSEVLKEALIRSLVVVAENNRKSSNWDKYWGSDSAPRTRIILKNKVKDNGTTDSRSQTLQNMSLSEVIQVWEDLSNKVNKYTIIRGTGKDLWETFSEVESKFPVVNLNEHKKDGLKISVCCPQALCSPMQQSTVSLRLKSLVTEILEDINETKTLSWHFLDDNYGISLKDQSKDQSSLIFKNMDLKNLFKAAHRLLQSYPEICKSKDFKLRLKTLLGRQSLDLESWKAVPTLAQQAEECASACIPDYFLAGHLSEDQELQIQAKLQAAQIAGMNQEMAEVNQGVREVKYLVLETASLVQAQGPRIGAIAANLDKAHGHVKEACWQLFLAQTFQIKFPMMGLLTPGALATITITEFMSLLHSNLPKGIAKWLGKGRFTTFKERYFKLLEAKNVNHLSSYLSYLSDQGGMVGDFVAIVSGFCEVHNPKQQEQEEGLRQEIMDYINGTAPVRRNATIFSGACVKTSRDSVTAFRGEGIESQAVMQESVAIMP